MLKIMIKRGFIVFLLSFILISGCVPVETQDAAVSGMHSEGMNMEGHVDDGHTHAGDDHSSTLVTFGPGDAPMTHVHEFGDLQRKAEIMKPASDLPGPLERKEPATVRMSLETKEIISEIAPGIAFSYWTFNETVPGPFLRVREEDTVELTLFNHETSTHNHSIDLHAVTGPGGGAVMTQVAPGEQKTVKFKALNPGLYVYHCATANVPNHMTNGMYGLILVEPKEGLPKVDKEFYVMQGELYTQGKMGEKGLQDFDGAKMLEESPEYIVFNGKVKSLVENPMQAEVGDKVRLFVDNGGVAKVSSFHVIGEIFDTVYAEGSTSNPFTDVQTTMIPAGGSAIVEFGLEVPGNYVLVDHALARLDRGAWGLLRAEGDEHPEIFSGQFSEGSGH